MLGSEIFIFPIENIFDNAEIFCSLGYLYFLNAQYQNSTIGYG